jgi:hypothetical protein
VIATVFDLPRERIEFCLLLLNLSAHFAQSFGHREHVLHGIRLDSALQLERIEKADIWPETNTGRVSNP